MFSNLKLYGIAIAFLTYSIGLWTVSSGYAENKYNKERLEAANEAIRRADHNATLSFELSQGLVQLDKDRQELTIKLRKEINAEIQANPIYRDCRVTDGVRNALQRQIDRQAGRSSAPEVRAIPGTSSR